MLDVNAIDFAKGGGTVTVIAQDAVTGAVLMVAQADREALERTIATGEMHYRSRSRGLWHKGATSGNVQRVVTLTADCDGDAVLARVVPAGPACHTGERTCFGEAGQGDALAALDATIASRQRSSGGGSPPKSKGRSASSRAQHHSSDAVTASPQPSYTLRLLADRNLRLKKLGEEAGELAVACADGNARRATEEAADLVYHVLVALHAVGVTLADVQRTLDDRAHR
ncbi:MAG TPA: phosphoribosyl-ATP diphosphatase [Gemmatimonadaceae bacterium]|jgi:phosphoribosyl-ATP pyrophosphohydrolase/phosphoribosyl-AMP cyclohydrolase|nr:phosphoribosyl-ATP diphosphatase [Gemmatimonadaceae bacterium]